MEIFYMVLGLVGIYSIIHFTIIQFMKKWTDRSAYEKTITVFALTFIFLIILGSSVE